MTRKIIKFVWRTVLVLLILFIVLLLVLDRFIQFRMDNDEIRAFFSQKGVPVEINYYETQGRKLRYIATGKDTTATILFIHGAPSSSTYYKDYLTDSILLQRAHLIAVDRPGYGYSGLADPLTSVETQAKVIRPLLDSLQQVHHPVVVVGASYGTTIACRIAMDYPDVVDGLVLIAPALASGEEKTYWFSPMIESPLVHWIVPRMLQTANAEKLAHPKELAAMLPLWPRIKVPVHYLQGANDELVYTSNAIFAKEKMVNVPFLSIDLIPGRGHLIAFNERERIRNSILQMLTRAKQY